MTIIENGNNTFSFFFFLTFSVEKKNIEKHVKIYRRSPIQTVSNAMNDLFGNGRKKKKKNERRESERTKIREKIKNLNI